MANAMKNLPSGKAPAKRGRPPKSKAEQSEAEQTTGAQLAANLPDSAEAPSLEETMQRAEILYDFISKKLVSFIRGGEDLSFLPELRALVMILEATRHLVGLCKAVADFEHDGSGEKVLRVQLSEQLAHWAE